MSYAISVIGTIDGIKRTIEEHSARLTDQSKRELDDVKPALFSILDQNVGSYSGTERVFAFDANGHASIDANGVKTYGNGTVSLKELGSLAK